ncbi:MAG: hypothetical protein QXD48_00980 [Candidatus Aenigmatarchaeota archaeon]
MKYKRCNFNKLIRKNIIFISFLIILVSVLIIPFVYAQLTFTGRGCQGNQICDTKTECDIFGNCNTEYSNCISCGTTTASCPAGIAYCENTCESLGNSAECKKCTPDCSAMQLEINEPHVILKFNVFTKKNFITDITPKTQTTIAGKTVNYKVTLENKHPKSITLKLGLEVPKGWTYNLQKDLQMSANSKKDVTFTVTSNLTESDGSYTITFVAFSQELNIFDKISAEYVIASRGPPSVEINPKTLDGSPGQMLMYTVKVINNDPPDFDPSTITLTAVVPKNWEAEFDQNSFRLKPDESAEAKLFITSPITADESSYSIIVNATANKLSSLAYAEYKINLCGNGICEVDENCEKDCLSEQYFLCDGRCEKEVDDGVEFSANLDFMFTKFIVCSRNATIQNCEAYFNKNNCGYGKPCLCGGDDKSLCLMRCVDHKGAYYLYAKNEYNVRSTSNYSFSCPYVNLPEIIQIRNNFTNAKVNYEKAQSTLKEVMNKNATERTRLMPCYDILNIIIRNITNHISYLDAVIASPAKSNTTIARQKTDELRTRIESLYNKYCRGSAGLLKIESVNIPSAIERGNNIRANIFVKNIGNTNYYGYPECDFVDPSGQKTTVKERCMEMPVGFSKTFTLSSNATTDGNWKIMCRVYGSLESDCSTEIHDETDFYQINVYSKDVYVVDVSGQCESNSIKCSVRINKNLTCSKCKIGNTDCSFISQDGDASYFSCPKRGFGLFNLTGYVIQTDYCIPVLPKEKNITVSCSGCGDNIVDQNEKCELPNTNNNRNCIQQEWMCDGKKYAYRDKYGFCTPTCDCSFDEYKYVCSKGKCGALCSDGETKNKTIVTIDGKCTCVQQCNENCEWSDCYCEVQPKYITNVSVEILDVSVSNSCPEEKGYIDVMCTVSTPRVDCIKLKIGTNECVWNNYSYWYGNTAVFSNCAVGLKTNTQCGNQSREVKCYVDKTRCSQIGTDKITWIDVMPATKPNVTIPQCYIDIISKNCSFNPRINRYDATMRVIWNGGDHAHGKIEDEESKMMRTKEFKHTIQLGTPGMKKIEAYVHNPENKLICYNSTEIYCGAGPTIGNLFDVIREMKDTTRTGWIDVKLHIIPYITLSDFTLTEHVEKNLTVINRTVYGNTSAVISTGPSTVSLEKDYSAYSWKLDLESGKNVTISYKVGINKEGEYKFFSKSKYLNEVREEEKYLLVSNCHQIKTTWARNNLTGTCTSFKTPCDVPSFGWKIVPEGCPTEEGVTIIPKSTEEGFDFGMIILIIIIIIIVAVLFMKREVIKEKIEEWRYGKEEI